MGHTEDRELTYSDAVCKWLSAWANAYESNGLGKGEVVLDGICMGLLLAAHRASFAGKVLEEMSDNKNDFQGIRDSVIETVDLAEQHIHAE
jgi:hypothetical protein